MSARTFGDAIRTSTQCAYLSKCASQLLGQVHFAQQDFVAGVASQRHKKPLCLYFVGAALAVLVGAIEPLECLVDLSAIRVSPCDGPSIVICESALEV